MQVHLSKDRLVEYAVIAVLVAVCAKPAVAVGQAILAGIGSILPGA